MARSHSLTLAGTAFLCVALLPAVAFGELPVGSASAAARSEQAKELIAELGCSGCHAGLGDKGQVRKDALSEIRAKAPDLGDAGLRFQSAYLFDFLQRPGRVRKHIGRSRMPDFQFSEAESLALTRYLALQDQSKPGLRGAEARIAKERAGQTKTGRELITESFPCLSCHSLNGERANSGGELGAQAVDLSTIAYRLKREWVESFVAFPWLHDPATAMPGLFYSPPGRPVQRSGPESFMPLVPHAAESIERIADYLESLGGAKLQELVGAYERALAKYPDGTSEAPSEAPSEAGRRLFVSQNCAACHAGVSDTIPGPNGPNLGFEGARVKRSWLLEFLRAPRPIRPFGYRPGSGSRMPDFGLSDAEVTLLSDYLMLQREGFEQTLPRAHDSSLSPFAMRKAQQLIEKTLPCLGCHQLGATGGRIGPDLSGAKARLQPAFIRKMIDDPVHTIQGRMMPRSKMSPDSLSLVSRFLAQNDFGTQESRTASSIDGSIHPANPTNPADAASPTPLAFPGPQANRGETLFLDHCAACHGIKGDGDGYNARYTPTPPAVLSDKERMSKRADDSLYDVIHAGGRIVARQHSMPAWGQTLSSQEIRDLVAHIRVLCDCEAPAWSRNPSSPPTRSAR